MFPVYLDDCSNSGTSFPVNLQIHHIAEHIPLHRHNFVEFFYVLEGTGQQRLNGQTFTLQSGVFCVILPYQVHDITPYPGTVLVLYNCSITLDALLDAARHPFSMNRLLFEHSDAMPAVQLSGDEQQRMLHTFREMDDEFQNERPWREASFYAKMTEAFISFDRHRRSSDALNEALTAQAAEQHAVWRAIHYVYQHYREPITLRELAARFQLNASYLSSAFKAGIGMSFVSFLHQTRLQHAVALLQSTEAGITDIAYEVGFDSYETFSRVFRKAKGMSPSAYRSLIVKALPS